MTQTKRLVDQSKAKGLRGLSYVSRLWLRFSPLLPLIFPIGWVLCHKFFGNSQRFLWISLLATFDMFVLLAFLRKPVEDIFPIIILLAIFLVGYYLKFYWLALEVDAGNIRRLLLFLDPHTKHVLYAENMLDAFELSTWGFTAFCCAAVIFVVCRINSRSLSVTGIPENPIILRRYKTLSEICVFAGFVIWVVTFSLTNWLGIGIHKHTNTRLPNNVAGLIIYGGELVPYLFIFAMSRSNRKGLRTQWWHGLTGLVIYGLGRILGSGSRGALVTALVIPLGVLWLLDKQLTRKHLFFLMIILLVTALARPVFTAYRTVRADSDNFNIVKLLSQTYENAQRTDSSVAYGSMIDSLVKIAERVVGFETVLFVVPVNPGEGDISLVLRGGLSQKFTQDIVGYGPNVTTHFNPPGLVGGLYFLGGTIGVVLGIFAFVLISQELWGYFYRSRWWTAPVALTMIASTIFGIGSDAAFENAVRSIFAKICFALFLEFVGRVR